MFAIRKLSRFRAAAIHLGISAAIAVATMAVMLTLWYPAPLFGAMGGKLLVLLIVGVDVAIGPLLTLIVFDPRKKELPFDLSVIAVLQLSALIYGIHAMHAGRPVFIAFIENRFAVVSAASIEDGALMQAKHPEFRTLSKFGPVVVAIEMPTDINARNDIVFASLGGLGAEHLPQYYVPYADKAGDVIASAQPLEKLSVIDADAKAEVVGAIARAGRQPHELLFLPMTTEFTTLTALIDAKSGTLLATAAAKPIEHGVPVVSGSGLGCRGRSRPC